jgi:hypothetical protein
MQKSSWIRTWAARLRTLLGGPRVRFPTKPARQRPRKRLHLESLEDRCVPATLTVTSPADTATPPAGTVTLRSALVQAETDPGPDTITFAPALLGMTLVLDGTALPTLTRGETITGPGASRLTIDANDASRIFVVTSATPVTLSGLTLTGGNAGPGGNGGAVQVNGGVLQLSDLTFSGNTTSGTTTAGAALDTTGVGALVTATACTFSGNMAGLEGGAIENEATATMTLTGCQVISNTANGGGNGGGIANHGQLTITGSAITFNTGAGGPFFGGGIYNSGALTLTNSSVLGNTSQGAGGGVYSNGMVCNVSDCTLANNLTLGVTGGGAIRVAGGPLNLLNDTITQNNDASGSGTNAGGVSFSGTTFTLSNTVVALNFASGANAPPDLRAAVAGGSVNNFIGVGDVNLTGISNGSAGNQIGAVAAPLNPLLGPLQANGVTPSSLSALLTEEPLPASPLIDAGSDDAAASLATDERGFLRIVGAHVDIGAVEFQPPTVTVTLSLGNSGPLPAHRAITLTAQVAAAPGSTSPNNPITGTVTFLANGTIVLGTAKVDPTGTATFTTTASIPLPVGTDQITAQYNGDSNYAAALSAPVQQTVIQPTTTSAAFDPATATWYIRFSTSAGATDIPPFQFGAPGWEPIMGDWNGDGVWTIGVFDPATATFYLRNSNSPGAADITFQFGPAGVGAIPVAGDWDGDGITTIGVFDPTRANWNLRNENSSGLPDAGSFLYGLPGSKPVVGDWTGSGRFTIGVVEPSGTWKLKNQNVTGTPDFTFAYGAFGDHVLVGDWNGDGIWSPGDVANQSGLALWQLRDSNSGGAPSIAPYLYGSANWIPVTGDFTFPAQFAADGQGPGAAWLSQADLDGTVQAALARLQQAGVSQDVLDRLAGTTAVLEWLAPGQLGAASPSAHQIMLSPDAAGHGWFVDRTPLQDEEFSGGQALPGSTAASREDLLTVVLHELGHLAGLPDNDGSGLMGELLPEGTRPTGALDRVFAGTAGL